MHDTCKYRSPTKPHTKFPFFKKFWGTFFCLLVALLKYICYIIYRYKKPQMNKTEALQTAETIFKQLGGQRTLKLFVGATNFAFNNLEKEERVEASFKFKGSRKMNHCKVTYRRCPDDYIVEFYKIGKASVTKVSRHEGIYCDMLIDLFEKETDLYLHF